VYRTMVSESWANKNAPRHDIARLALAKALFPGIFPVDVHPGLDRNTIRLQLCSNAPKPVMNIILNGEPRPLDQALTVSELLMQLGATGKRVAVEVNQEIVPRSEHANYRLKDNDRVEVVQAIGGG
jgi:sulfur carrier protein